MHKQPPLTFRQLHLPYPKHGIIGHRGLASQAPENTKASFIAAATAGLSWVEFDIQPCASGEWVVFHDETLSRMGHGSKRIRECQLHDLQSLDIGSWFNPMFTNERILSLNEVLPLLSQLRLHPNIEVKLFDNEDSLLMANLAIELGSLIQAHWPDQSTAPALVSSFSYPFLTAMRAQYPDCPIGYLVEGFNEQKIEIATAASFNTLHADKKSLVTYLDKHDIKSQLPIFCYTVNDAPTAKRLFDKGISAIFSDKAKLFG